MSRDSWAQTHLHGPSGRADLDPLWSLTLGGENQILPYLPVLVDVSQNCECLVLFIHVAMFSGIKCIEVKWRNVTHNLKCKD